MSSECESLLRRILVLDPSRRYSISQIKNHQWMQAEAPVNQASRVDHQGPSRVYHVPEVAEKMPERSGPMNEQILRLMQDLGIDPVRTKESVERELYDHHSAIYYLLIDRLNKQKQSVCKQEGSDVKKRRPSTIAEQPLKGIQGGENLHSLRLRNTSESDNITGEAGLSAVVGEAGVRTVPGEAGIRAVAGEAGVRAAAGEVCIITAGGETGLRAPAGCVAPAEMQGGMLATEFTCITCGCPILENTTSTTACVKCARLRTRRMNFAHPPTSSSLGPWDSRDSGVSSQDCGEITPTLEQRAPLFPKLCLVQSSRQLNKLARKLCEVEGIDHSGILRSVKTSVDEGIELNCSDSTLSDTLSAQCAASSPGGSSGRLAEHKDGLDLSITSSSSGRSESIDGGDNLDEGWTQSLPSCSESTAPYESERLPVQIYRGVCRYNPIAPQHLTNLTAMDRGVTRSPVNFREGRRASDGLVAQGIIAFQQKLYEKEKAGGMVQLHQVRLEVAELQSKYQDPRQQRQQLSTEEHIPLVVGAPKRAAVSKRISVPENFVYFPPAKHFALQQQLLLHRLNQKRQGIQKHRLAGQGETILGLRRVSYGKPYLPTEGLPYHQSGSDFVFQPIAEDEPCGDDYQRRPIAHSVSYQPTDSGSGSYISTCLPSTQYTFPIHNQPRLTSLNSSSQELEFLPREMEFLPHEMEMICKLTDSPRGSPAPQ